jgi:HEAT repeat protein
MNSIGSRLSSNRRAQLMTVRFNRFHCLVSVATCLAFSVVVTDPNDGSASAADPKRVEPLLQSVADGKELDAEASDQIPDLIAVVEKGDHQESELAIRVLTTMGSKASPAIEAIGEKLHDPTHATRSAAVDALVAIGQECAGYVRDLLSSPRGRTRAAAAAVLARLKVLSLNDLGVLANDADARVRATAANAHSQLGKPAVALLADLLQDPELAVAAEAAQALRVNRDDVTIAVGALMKALPRAELGGIAVDALSAYGVGAQRAIPAIIKAHPLGRSHSSFLDATEDALQHIGPPDVNDIPELCTLLGGDEKTRIVVAKCLGGLGLDGRPTADALESAAKQSIDDYVAQMQAPRSKAIGSGNSGRLLVAGEEMRKFRGRRFARLRRWESSRETTQRQFSF